MPDGRITKDDLVDSKAISAYTDLSTNAVIALDAIIKKLDELAKIQSQLSQSDTVKLASQLAINKALEEGQNKLNDYKATLELLANAKNKKATAEAKELSAFKELQKVTREADDAVKSSIITEGEKTDAINKDIEKTKELKTQIKNLNEETKLATDTTNKHTKVVQSDYSETNKLTSSILLQKQHVSELTLMKGKDSEETKAAIVHLRSLLSAQKEITTATKLEAEAKKTHTKVVQSDYSEMGKLTSTIKLQIQRVQELIRTKGRDNEETKAAVASLRASLSAQKEITTATKLETAAKQTHTKVIQTDYSEMGKLTTAISLQKQKVQELTVTRQKDDPELKKAITNLRALQAQLKGVNENVKGATTSTSSFGTSIKNLLKSVIAFIGVRMFFQFLKDTFELTKKLDTLKFSMSAILKSNEDISKSTSFLNRITRDYGASIVKTTESYIRFIAAAQQSKVTLKDTQQIFETFTKVSGVLGLNSQSLSEIFLALEQMLSKGKITTEELRRQLGEKLPGAFGIMATTLGVSTTALDKMLRKGEVLSGEVLPKFAKQVEIAFGLNSVTKINTLQASSTRLSNAWVKVFNDFKNGTGLVAKLSGIIDFLTDNLKITIEVVSFAVIAFGTFRATVVLSTLTMKAFSTAIKIAKGEIIAFSTALKANLLGIAVIAVEALVAGYYALTGSAEDATQAIKDANDAFAENAEKTLNSIKSTNELIDTYETLSKKVGENYTEQVGINKQIQDNSKYIEILNDKIKSGADANGVYAEKLRLTKNENIGLAEKTSLFKDEQEQLNTITRTLSKTFPTAKTELNKYGDAVIIATDDLKKLNAEKEKEFGLSIKVQNTKIYEDLKTFYKKDTELYKAYIKEKKDLESSQISAGRYNITDKATLAKIKEQDKNALDALTNKYNEEKRVNASSKQSALDALKTNNESLFSLTEQGKALEKKRLDEEKASKEAQSNLKNRINLQEKLNELETEANTIEASNKFIKEKNGAENIKGTDRLIAIRKEKEDIQVEIDKINALLGENKSGGGSRSSVKQPKELKTFDNQTNNIAKANLQNEIDTNKRIIESDETLYADKIRLAQENESLLKDINIKEYVNEVAKNEKLRLEDIKNAEESGQSKEKIGAKILEINDYYRDLNILAEIKYNKDVSDIEYNAEKEKDAIAKKEVETNKQILDAKLSDIKLALDKELEANRTAFDKGELTRREFRDANRKAYDEAQSEGIKAIDAVFDTLIKIMTDAGLSTNELTKALNLLKLAFTNMGQSGNVAITSTEKWVIALDTVGQALNKIGEISRNASDARINDIEKEISAEEEKYARLKVLAGDNVSTKEALDIELAAHVKVLKEKERKEKEKQWKIDKKVALAEAAINIAVAITNAAKKGFWNIAPIIALGALELGVIASQKMPAFAKGGKMGFDGKALINDGGKKEFVERKGFIYTTSYENSVVDLKKGDIIHKDYDSLMNSSIMKSIANSNNGLNVGKMMNRDFSNLEGSIKKGFNGVKNVINLSTQKIDIPQALYRQSKVKWG